MAFLRLKAKKIEKDIQKLLICVSESLRSMIFFYFNLSAPRLSTINLFFTFPRHA